MYEHIKRWFVILNKLWVANTSGVKPPDPRIFRYDTDCRRILYSRCHTKEGLAGLEPTRYSVEH